VEQRELPLARLSEVSDTDPDQSDPSLVEPGSIAKQVDGERFDQVD